MSIAIIDTYIENRGDWMYSSQEFVPIVYVCMKAYRSGQENVDLEELSEYQRELLRDMYAQIIEDGMNKSKDPTQNMTKCTEGYICRGEMAAYVKSDCTIEKEKSSVCEGACSNGNCLEPVEPINRCINNPVETGAMHKCMNDSFSFEACQSKIAKKGNCETCTQCSPMVTCYLKENNAYEFCSQGCINNTCTSYSCSDSDNGDIFTPGQVHGIPSKDSDFDDAMGDYCLNKSTLKEFSVDDNCMIRSRDVYCVLGCYRGACNNADPDTDRDRDVDYQDIYNVAKCALAGCTQYDFDKNGKVDQTDVEFVESVLTVKKGDLNGDGIIDAVDEGVMYRCLTSKQELCYIYDMDGDGQLTEKDLNQLRQTIPFDCKATFGTAYWCDSRDMFQNECKGTQTIQQVSRACDSDGNFFCGACVYDCTESDGGRNFGVKGSVTGLPTANYSDNVAEDYCPSNNLLREFYVDQNCGIQMVEKECSCQDGACIEPYDCRLNLGSEYWCADPVDIDNECQGKHIILTSPNPCDNQGTWHCGRCLHDEDNTFTEPVVIVQEGYVKISYKYNDVTGNPLLTDFTYGEPGSIAAQLKTQGTVELGHNYPPYSLKPDTKYYFTITNGDKELYRGNFTTQGGTPDVNDTKQYWCVFRDSTTLQTCQSKDAQCQGIVECQINTKDELRTINSTCGKGTVDGDYINFDCQSKATIDEDLVTIKGAQYDAYSKRLVFDIEVMDDARIMQKSGNAYIQVNGEVLKSYTYYNNYNGQTNPKRMVFMIDNPPKTFKYNLTMTVQMVVGYEDIPIREDKEQNPDGLTNPNSKYDPDNEGGTYQRPVYEEQIIHSSQGALTIKTIEELCPQCKDPEPVLFMGDGNHGRYDIFVTFEDFTDAKARDFLNAAFGNSTYSIFKTEPFDQYKDRFNVYYFIIPKINYEESGTCKWGSTYQEKIERFNYIFNQFTWIDSRIYYSKSKSVWPHAYLGTGIVKMSNNCNIGGNLETFAKVLTHELGHSFGNLKDEYTYSGNTGIYNYMNCNANSTVPDRWKNVTGYNQKTYKGCTSTVSYRGTSNSMMKNQYSYKSNTWADAWGPINRQYLYQRLELIGP